MRMSKTLVAFALAVVASTGAVGRTPASGSDVAADVRLLAKTFEETHPRLFRPVSRERFRAEVESLARRAPTLSANELFGLMRIAALPGPRNGHTGIVPLAGHRRPLHLNPLRLYDFAGGVHVVDERTDRDDLIGSRLVSLSGVPTARLLEIVRPLVSRDNATGRKGYAPHFALTAEVLDGLGIVDGAGAAEFRFGKPTGEAVALTLAPIEAGEYAAVFGDALYGHYPAILPSRPRPLYLARSNRPLWMTKLASGRGSSSATTRPAFRRTRQPSVSTASRGIRR
jgi:hypothetical protein